MGKSLIRLCSLLILIIFVTSYIISASGYYEYSILQKRVISSDKIKEFEEDIKNNKDMDLVDYLDKDRVNYSNKITTLVYNISDNSNKLVKKVIKAFFRDISSFLSE